MRRTRKHAAGDTRRTYSRPQIPTEVEQYHDVQWCREATRLVETVAAAERFVEQVGLRPA